MSYENQAGNVDGMVALIANIPSYNPNENRTEARPACERLPQNCELRTMR